MEKVMINKERNEVLLKFNELFYNWEFIGKAINDFCEICDIEKSENGLLLKPKKEEDVDEIGYEFYNYVLSLMKNQ